jgi:hypothetical protein
LLAYGAWLFAAIFLLAVILAALPRLIEFGSRIQNHPKLLEQAVTLRERVDELEDANRVLQLSSAAQFAAGITEGFARARGAVLARLAGEPPSLKAVAEREGQLVLIGEYEEEREPPDVGARYGVQDVYTTEQKGVVEVTLVEKERRLVFMNCVEPSAAGFWDQLSQRAAAETRPPDSVVLVPVDYGSGLRTSKVVPDDPELPALEGPADGD